MALKGKMDFDDMTDDMHWYDIPCWLPVEVASGCLTHPASLVVDIAGKAWVAVMDLEHASQLSESVYQDVRITKAII